MDFVAEEVGRSEREMEEEVEGTKGPG